MGENTINMNRSQLKEMIDKSVSKVLTELDWKTYMNASSKVRGKNKWATSRSLDFRDSADDSGNEKLFGNSEGIDITSSQITWVGFRYGYPLAEFKDGSEIIPKECPYARAFTREYNVDNDSCVLEKSIKGGESSIYLPISDDKVKECFGDNIKQFNLFMKAVKEYNNYKTYRYNYDNEQGWHLKESSLKEGYGDSDYAVMERAEEMIRNGYDYGYIEDGQTWEELTEGGPYSDIYESAEALSEEFDINIDEALNYLQKAFNGYENMYEGKKVKQVTISESKLREMIKESTKRMLKENNEFYPEKLLFYPEGGELAGDMGYEFMDKGSLGANSSKNIINGIVEYFTYDYPSEKEETYDNCAVVYYTGNPQKLYISSLDSAYKNDIAIAATKKFGTEIPIEVVGNNISESKLREMIKESTKKILKENFDDDDIFITAYDIIQNGIDEIVQKHGVTPNVASQELLKVLNTFESDDIYDDGDDDLGEDENF